MSSTEGFYFECEPVEAKDGTTQIKEVIELRYPNLSLEIDDDSKSNYLQLIFLIIFFSCCMIVYTNYGSPGYEIIITFACIIAALSLLFILLTAIGIFKDS